MKICAVIAEYNPFHNGHLKQINYVKENLDCDKLLVHHSVFTTLGKVTAHNDDKFFRTQSVLYIFNMC